jgi:signal transduction histidine kinase/CheY-like chemotaxis protein
MNSTVDTGIHAEETILIVDDEIETAGCFRAILEYAGYRTVIVESGEEAVRMVSEKKFDAVIMDLVMKGMDGVTAVQKIKNLVPDDEFLPVILITAFFSEENKIAGLSCADGFMGKPASSNELVATVRSLLKIRRLTRELALAKEKYHRFYDNIPHLCISVKTDGTIISSNKLFSSFCDAPKSKIEGTSVYTYLRPEEHALFASFIEAVTNTDGIPHQNVFTFILRATEKPYKLSVRAASVNDDLGGKTIVLAMEDITQKLNLEEERKVARKQLYRSANLASIGTLASGVAHEMNNPLTAILGFSSALLNRMSNKEEIAKDDFQSYLQVIHNETIRCRDIVEHLHRFARDSGEAKIGRHSLLECIVDALRLVNMKAVRSEITILNDIQEDAWVLVDTNKLEQVLINLLTNCIDFCPAGTTVHIAKLPEKRESRFVGIVVRDNGPGMQPDVLAKAFDPFFTTKEVGKGIGMGLAISYKIMDELNGRIDISSEPNKGTTILLEIPHDR